MGCFKFESIYAFRKTYAPTPPKTMKYKIGSQMTHKKLSRDQKVFFICLFFNGLFLTDVVLCLYILKGLSAIVHSGRLPDGSNFEVQTTIDIGLRMTGSALDGNAFS